MTGLPAGARLTIGDDVWRYDDGRVLVGGAPTRVMRLSAGAARLITDGAVELADPASRRVGERLLDAGLAHPDLATLPPVSADGLTVVIPAYGRSGQLRRLLAGLRGLRVIVVDDVTPGPEASRVHRVVAESGARLVVMKRNRGPASARNHGLRLVETPFVAFIDTDVVVDAGPLTTLLRHFADPGLAVVGPRIVGAGDGTTWIEQYENARSSLDLGRRPALVRPRSSVAWISTTCVVARTAALGDGFTDGMRVGEDVELMWRLAKSGWRVRYEPRVSVSHEHRRSIDRWFARKFFYGTGAAPLAQRHPDAIPPAILRPWSAAVVVALCSGRRWSVPVAAGIAGVAMWRLGRRLGVTRETRMLPVRLVGSGVLSALTQVSALALRHWWPVAAVAGALSRRARWLIAIAAVGDAVIEHRRLRGDLGFVRFALARRIDDIAYGAGVWWGCLRQGSFRALRVELRPPAPGGTAGRVGETAGQVGETAGQVEETAGQVEETAGQVGGTAGQVEETAGQVGGVRGSRRPGRARAAAAGRIRSAPGRG